MIKDEIINRKAAVDWLVHWLIICGPSRTVNSTSLRRWSLDSTRQVQMLLGDIYDCSQWWWWRWWRWSQCVRTASCYVGDRGSASDLRCRPATAVSEKTSNSQVFFSFVQCLWSFIDHSKKKKKEFSFLFSCRDFCQVLHSRPTVCTVYTGRRRTPLCIMWSIHSNHTNSCWSFFASSSS